MKLDLCAHCGGTATQFQNWGLWQIVCECGSRTRIYFTETECVAAWNRRVVPPEIQARAKELSLDFTYSPGLCDATPCRYRENKIRVRSSGYSHLLDWYLKQ